MAARRARWTSRRSRWDDLAVAIKTADERRVEIARHVRVEACNNAAPLSRHERQRDFAHAQVIVGRLEAALGFDRKIEILVPITSARSCRPVREW